MKNGLSNSILDAIGDTPMLEVEGIYCKLEYLNPSGSIKARIAKYMVERAEDEGLLKHGDTIVEATSGNTGNALSMVAAVKGYRMLVVMPEGMSGERVAISRAFGAEVMEVGHFHVNEALAKAKELGQEPGYFCPAQFESEWNVEENRIWLGPEILSQLPEGVVPDAIVMGVGTGGTLIGVGQAFREVNPDVKLFAMEPSESSTILCGEMGDHLIEGISDGFVPGIFERHQRPRRHRPDRRLRGGRRGDAPPRQAIRALRRPFQRRQPDRRPEGARGLPRASDHRHPVLRRGREVHKRPLRERDEVRVTSETFT